MKLHQLIKKFNYLKRIFSAYIIQKDSPISFWHSSNKISDNINVESLDIYYMEFFEKGNYRKYLDKDNIPMLNYYGDIGVQYNPIAISQFGLGNFNLYKKNKDKKNKELFIACSDWLVSNIRKNKKGVWVWMHNFDFEYKEILQSPWYSGLAQGQGISLLVRAYKETNERKYLDTAEKAYNSFLTTVENGGVTYISENQEKWIEEYITQYNTHILNGFIWAIWGVYDYWLLNPSDKNRLDLFHSFNKTILNNLDRYDNKFWSFYELSNNKIGMIASHFYHDLHINQLEIMYILTSEKKYLTYSKRWKKYQKSILNRTIALITKIISKIFYY